jgi:uncharacterized membrane protein
MLRLGAVMNYIKILGIKVNYLFFYFVSCSFIGWCIETSYMFFTRGRFVSSGLINSPFCPIYGFGGLMLIIMLRPVKHNVILFFIGAVIVTTLLEYITGYSIKLILNRRVWDYSGEFLNVNGLVCLKTSLVWGLLSLNFMYFIKPLIRCAVFHLPKNMKSIIAYSVFLFFIVKAGNWLWTVGNGFKGF